MRKRPADQPVRVLIVEDSRPQLELLMGMIEAAADLRVVGTAVNGRDAVDAAHRLRPDVIAMDIYLPLLDGYEATRQIMQRCPTPIVLVSSSQGDAERRSLDALAAGALAVVRKPSGPASAAHAFERQNLLTTLRLMADVPVVTRHAPRSPPPPAGAVGRPGDRAAAAARPEVLAIAASTGGPAALQTVLAGLGRDFPLPVLVAQHIADGFVGALAEWLGATLPAPVQLARQGEPLQPGRVYLAPQGYHLVTAGRGRAGLRLPRSDDRYTPSADVLFESVAAAYGAAAAGVILTGMGDDGARGLLLLRQAGGRTVAQDQATCVVYGMPQAASRIGAAEQIAPLGAVADVVRALARGAGERGRDA